MSDFIKNEQNYRQFFLLNCNLLTFSNLAIFLLNLKEVAQLWTNNEQLVLFSSNEQLPLFEIFYSTRNFLKRATGNEETNNCSFFRVTSKLFEKRAVSPYSKYFTLRVVLTPPILFVEHSKCHSLTVENYTLQKENFECYESYIAPKFKTSNQDNHFAKQLILSGESKIELICLVLFNTIWMLSTYS